MESRVEQLFSQTTPSEVDADRDEITLSQDPAMWQTEVHQALVQTVALPPEAIPMVEIQMEDEEQQDASGAITIDIHGIQLVVPIVIRQGNLAPMDVFFIQGKEEDVRPLSTQNVNELMAQGQFDYKAVSTQGSAGNGSLVDETLLGDASQMNQLQGPYGWEYGYAKFASASSSFIVDLMENQALDKEAAAEFVTSLSSEDVEALESLPNTSTNFGEPVHTGGITKLNAALQCLAVDRDYAAVHGQRDVHPSQELNPARLAATDVYQIRMLGPGKYRVHATCDRVFIPMVRDLSGSEVRALLESVCARYSRRERHDVGRVVQSFLRTLMTCGEITLVTRSNPGKPAVLWPQRNVVEDVNRFARYHLRQEGGLGDVGLAIPEVYDFDGTRLPMVLFVSEKTSNWALQESMAGVRDTMGASFVDLEKLDDPSGRKVVLTWLGPDETPRCLPPMNLQLVERDGDHIEILMENQLGDGVRLVCDPAVRHPVALPGDEALDSSGRRAYLFPAAHAAIRVCKRREYTTTTASFEKMGEQMENEEGSARDLRLVPSASGGFNVKLGSFVRDDLSRADARLLLATCGASQPESRVLLEKAAEAGPNGLKLRTRMKEPITDLEEVEKLASAHTPALSEEQREAAAGAASRIRALVDEADVVKLAAGMPDAGTADRVLTTRFVTEDNVTMFKRYVPEFRKTVSRLGRLLLFSRLSGQLDEQSIKRAMVLLDQVIREVQQLTQTSLEDAYA